MFPGKKCILKVRNMLPWWYHSIAKKKVHCVPGISEGIEWLDQRTRKANSFFFFLQNNFILNLKWRISEVFWFIIVFILTREITHDSPSLLLFEKSAEWNMQRCNLHSLALLAILLCSSLNSWKKGCVLKGSSVCPSGEPLKVLCSTLEKRIEILYKTCNYPKNLYGTFIFP